MSRNIYGETLPVSSWDELEPEKPEEEERWTEDDDLLLDTEVKPTTPAENSARLVASIRPTSTASSLALDAVIEGLKADDLRGGLIDRIVATVYAIAERSGGNPGTRAAATRRRLRNETDHALAVTLRRRLEALLGLLRPVVTR